MVEEVLIYLRQQECLGFIVERIEQQSQSLPDQTVQHHYYCSSLQVALIRPRPSPGHRLFDWTLLQQDAVVHGGRRLIVFLLSIKNNNNTIMYPLCLFVFYLFVCWFAGTVRASSVLTSHLLVRKSRTSQSNFRHC